MNCNFKSFLGHLLLAGGKILLRQTLNDAAQEQLDLRIVPTKTTREPHNVSCRRSSSQTRTSCLKTRLGTPSCFLHNILDQDQSNELVTRRNDRTTHQNGQSLWIATRGQENALKTRANFRKMSQKLAQTRRHVAQPPPTSRLHTQLPPTDVSFLNSSTDQNRGHEPGCRIGHEK